MFLYFAFQGCHSGDNSFVQARPDYMLQVLQMSFLTVGAFSLRATSGFGTSGAMPKSDF